MKYERYSYRTFGDDERVQYAFVSYGSRGPINKMLTFSHFGEEIYNLALEDIDDDTGIFNQYAVTNNGDTQKILLTIAEAVVHFTSTRPWAQVFIKGNSDARNRLYRMYIGRFMAEIQEWYEVYGLCGKTWEIFETRGDYGAYLVIKLK